MAAWKDLLGALVRREELSADDAAWAMEQIVTGEATPAQISGFALLMRAKGETAQEIGGLVRSMLGYALQVEQTDAQRLATVDVVGTGGDQSHTVNISTMAALVTAGTGVRVIKHGNRAASSSCGTADVLEFLGIPLDLGPEQVARVADEAGIAFCFAQRFHPGARHAGPIRSQIGVPTFFNFLGPLTNPARPRSGAIGCADARMAPLMGQVYADRGDTVFVMRGEDGLDEFTTAGPTRVWLATGGKVSETTLDAADFGLPRSSPGDLRGADAPFNAGVLRGVLTGAPGPIRDAVLINAAMALTAHEWASRGTSGDLKGSLQANLSRAASSIDDGAAAAVLDRWIAAAQRAATA
ncbi:anthranilate phosphoribosyltransferase [Allorhizocola rhizosphaerae]|uniref:anthranilate phosphoribosyltransferase n=1 Tax=Allorhizocola rhizosphaerae TaxID=1872709 RepID=UPI000E3EB624|nr:anthranilate phosphoribosyltransferase [Allorhizocola rhizosphaerae]